MGSNFRGCKVYRPVCLLSIIIHERADNISLKLSSHGKFCSESTWFSNIPMMIDSASKWNYFTHAIAFRELTPVWMSLFTKSRFFMIVKMAGGGFSLKRTVKLAPSTRQIKSHGKNLTFDFPNWSTNRPVVEREDESDASKGRYSVPTTNYSLIVDRLTTSDTRNVKINPTLFKSWWIVSKEWLATFVPEVIFWNLGFVILLPFILNNHSISEVSYTALNFSNLYWIAWECNLLAFRHVICGH